MEMVKYSPADDWITSCMIRAKWLQAMPTPCGLLDADLIVLDRPSLLIDADFADYDFLTHVRPQSGENSRYCAGIVGFGNLNGKDTLDEWARLCKEDKTPGMALREQLYLYQAVQTVKPRIKDVGEAYNWVCPFGQTDVIPPLGTVIQHGDGQGPAHRRTRCDQ